MICDTHTWLKIVIFVEALEMACDGYKEPGGGIPIGHLENVVIHVVQQGHHHAGWLDPDGKVN